MELRKTRTGDFLAHDLNEVNDALLSFLDSLMRETTRMWFGGEASLLYRQNTVDHLLTITNGKTATPSALTTFIQLLRTLQMYRFMPEMKAEAENAIKHFIHQHLKFYFSSNILSEEGDGDRIQRVVMRDHGTYRLFLLLRLRAAFLMTFLADLTRVDARARHLSVTEIPT
jgi:hypothetical protein